MAEIRLTVLRGIRQTPQMSQPWREGRTLEVVRREPHVGATGKIQALHLSKWG